MKRSEMSAETRQIFRQFDKAVAGSVLVPNSLLPESYHGKKSHRSLRSVKKQYRKENPGETATQREKREKATRLDNYRAQVDNGAIENESLVYDVNEEKLYSAQVVFCGAMELAGVIQ